MKMHSLAVYFMVINVLGLSCKNFILDLFVKRILQSNQYPENLIIDGFDWIVELKNSIFWLFVHGQGVGVNFKAAETRIYQWRTNTHTNELGKVNTIPLVLFSSH